jgi:hypothetical protein
MLLSAGLAASAASGAEPPAGAAPATEREQATAELREKMRAINEQQRALLERMADIDAQRRELELMMMKVEDPDSYRGGQDASDAPPPVVGTEQKAEKEEAEAKAPEIPRVSFDVGGVLTPRGRLVLEPSFQYVYSAVDKLTIEGFTILPALLIGVIDVFEADRDTYIAALSTRYGITSRLEAELRVPYLWRRDSTRSREFLTDEVEETTRSADGNDIGDLELGIRYQFPRRPGWPYFTGNLRIKGDNGTDPFELSKEASLSGAPETFDELPTGSGFWSFNPSVTFIYPSDPVVFFGNLGYLWTVEDDKGGRDSTGEVGTAPRFGDVDPGDALRFNFGMGVSLNDRSSFSISYSLDVFDETEIELAAEPEIAGSDVTVGKFLIGYSLRLPNGSPLNLSIGIGATEDAPDTDITFRLPFNFLN